jgi:predicted Zn-ribbon and HTH transcriptional regulator
MGRAVNPTFGETDRAVQKYLASLKPSHCPECGKEQRTSRGEPMACPRCEKGMTLSKQRASVARQEKAAGRTSP